MEDRKDRKDFEWFLVRSGEKETPDLLAAFEHVKVFHVVSDSEARLVNHEEYMEMVRKELIAPPLTYWGIDEGRVGMVSPSFYRKYTESWHKVSNAIEDFRAGWRACERNLKESKR